MKITIGNNTIQNKAPKLPYLAKRKSTDEIYLVTHLCTNPLKCHAFNIMNSVHSRQDIDELVPIKQPVTFENEWE
jgi:hypothetical protein